MVYINARFLTQDLTGVQRFAESVAIALTKIRSDLVFVSPDDIKRKDVADRLNVVVTGQRKGHYWEQVELPRYLKSNGTPLLVNLGNTAPVTYAKKISTLHDITYKKFPQSYSRKFRIVYDFLIPRVLNTSLALLTVSEFSKKEIANFYNYPLERIQVIYNASSDIFKVNNTTSKELFFLAVSSNNYHKNFHGLISAYEKMSSVSNIKLKIIGGSSNSFSSSKAPSSGVMGSDRIEFLGRVSDEELVELYSSALAFVFPSLYEGFGIPPLEAQACGCPVVSSRLASMPEVLQDSALFFNPMDEIEFIRALERISQESQLRKDLRQKGYKNIERFSWDLSAEKLNEIIKSLE
ncbi:glycosyltransferase family 4 protein [Serratia proteamaculans]|uniref:glycosyltransferase family 4 protein n=1 Tax=Serratia proteamaculans TaxID=28151 RepID=UPI00217A9604|nr:glycosyltransferase family 1 protein [Serratia proteamaculans]CAI1592180.1 D-inositol-3-phosphate glycosyltransferase [Serratia proteamaculans]CAI2458532.1 D-inositol-3-phosphate glycosyltransferase [Serratia proteamaculans]